MDKRMISIVVIGLIILVLVGSVFAMSRNTEKISKDLILTIGNEKYYADEFNDYMVIEKEAAGEENKEYTSEELNTLISNFATMKMYSLKAEQNGITVPEDEINTFKENYESKKETFAKNGVTEEDYLNYSKDNYKKDELSNKFSEYYTLPNNIYDEVVNSMPEDKKSYSYRIMEFGYEIPEETSGDEEVESGEAIAEVDAESGEEEPDTTRETMLANAENALSRVKSGEDFQTVAGELMPSFRFTIKGSSYTIVKGDLEYSVSAILEQKIPNTDLYNAMTSIYSGETTEIIEDTENHIFYFAKVESVEDGFVGEANEELKMIILNEYKDYLVSDGVDYKFNDQAVMRIIYR